MAVYGFHCERMGWRPSGAMCGQEGWGKSARSRGVVHIFWQCELDTMREMKRRLLVQTGFKQASIGGGKPLAHNKGTTQKAAGNRLHTHERALVAGQAEEATRPRKRLG